MRTLRDILTEINEEDPSKQRKTDTKQRQDDLEDLLRRSTFQQPQKGEIEPVKPAPEQEPPQPERPRTFKKLSREETLRRLRGVQGNEEIARRLAGIDPNITDEISDEEARRIAGATDAAHQVRTPTPGEVEPRIETPNVPVVPNTIPKIISKDLQAAGEVVPEWHMVKHLPGYLASAIRSIGRGVFRPFTRTPLEDIQVVANLMGQGPNDDKELNAIAAHLVKNATRDRDAELIFHDRIPDYSADIKVFKDKGVSYLLVKDFAGHYIYAWPSDHEFKQLSKQPGKLPRNETE